MRLSSEKLGDLAGGAVLAPVKSLPSGRQSPGPPGAPPLMPCTAREGGEEHLSGSPHLGRLKVFDTNGAKSDRR